MPKENLRAVVIGAGWAGEGHSKALQQVGVEVAAICARQPEVVQAVADRLEVAEASTDWQRTVETVKPDIVALATPAGLRGPVVGAAAELGCHIFCDKPLATTAAEAERLYNLVDQAGVKHAYAATHCYDPSVAWLAELIENDTIGPLLELDIMVRLPMLAELAPWSWLDTLAGGGGMLNNGLTHWLGMLERIIGGQVVAATGAAQVLRQRAPVVPDLHDFRQMISTTLSAEEAAKLEWRACDADNAFTALLHFAGPKPNQPEVRVQIIINTMAAGPGPTNGWYFYGRQGTLLGEGTLALTVSRQDNPETDPEPLPIPQRLLDQLPQVGDDVQNKWVALSRDFVADIRGEAHQPYLTFKDGYRYQAVIEAIRASAGWHVMPD